VKDNPNKIWVVVSPKRARYPEYYQYNSVAEALSDFDDWTIDAGVESCEVLYRGITLMESAKGKVSDALCEQYYPDCIVRSKLPDSQVILNCEECVKKMIMDYVT